MSIFADLRLTRPASRRDLLLPVALAISLALLGFGCGDSASTTSVAEGFEAEIARLRAETAELPRLREEAAEAERLREEVQEIHRLRAQFQLLTRLRSDNERLRREWRELGGTFEAASE